MAEGGYEAYHVPQQSRRDKLRVVHLQSHPAGSSSSCCLVLEQPVANNLQGLLPLYDPSFLPSDLLTCSVSNPIKEEDSNNSMGFVGVGGAGLMNNNNNNNASSSSSRHLHQHPYPHLDPQGLNPNSQIQDINSGNSSSSAFLLTSPQNLNLREFGEVVVYKPEALSVTHHHQDQSNHNQAALSLSLSSLYYNNYHHHQNLPLELSFNRYGSPIINDKITPATTAAADGGGGVGYMVPAGAGGINLCSSAVGGGGNGGGSAASSYDLSASSVPLGPFTGYASILKGSRFLKPTQQLLEDYCSVGQRIIDAPSSSSMDTSLESLGRTDILDDEIESSSLDRGDGKKPRLISMLNEVYRKYKQFYHQMQAAVTSFESISGLGNAAPYAHLALKAMNKHFRCLKNAITDQLQFSGRTHGKDVSKLGSSDGGYCRQRSVHSPGLIDNQPVWRPQRGLPERAVSVLRAWLFEHFLHPYPTDTDKMMLAKQTGLSRNQVSNWFINARVRLWKPMVEEIHSLETRQGQRTSEWEEQNANRSSDLVPSSGTAATGHPSTSTQRNQDTPFKRTRNEFDAASRTDESSINLSSYGQFPSHLHLEGAGASTPLRSSNVSLSLGLHQNNGIVFSEPFPINASQRFGLGLDVPADGYVMNSFEAQTRHFG